MEKVLTSPCKGMNCGCTDGFSHSLECQAEHAAAVAGGHFVKAAQPQAQGEPEVVAWCALTSGGKSIAYFDGKPMVMCGPVGNEHHPVALITLQSHREALAKLEYGPLGKKFYEELSYSLQSERDDAINKADTLSEAIAKKDAALDACVEAAAKAIYEQWESHSGYVAWVEGGNSLMQEAARSIARAAITKIKEARG